MLCCDFAEQIIPIKMHEKAATECENRIRIRISMMMPCITFCSKKLNLLLALWKEFLFQNFYLFFDTRNWKWPIYYNNNNIYMVNSVSERLL